MTTIILVVITRKIVTSRIPIHFEWYFYFILLFASPILFFCCSVPFDNLLKEAEQQLKHQRNPVTVVSKVVL